MKVKDFNNIIKAIMKDSDELLFYLDDKEVVVKEFAITANGERKVTFTKKKKKWFWCGNKK